MIIIATPKRGPTMMLELDEETMDLTAHSYRRILHSHPESRTKERTSLAKAVNRALKEKDFDRQLRHRLMHAIAVTDNIPFFIRDKMTNFAARVMTADMIADLKRIRDHCRLEYGDGNNASMAAAIAIDALARMEYAIGCRQHLQWQQEQQPAKTQNRPAPAEINPEQ